MNKQLIAKLALIALAAGATAVNAATVSDTFQVKIKVTSVCKIKTAPTDIDLGSVDAEAIDQSANNTIKINCSKGTPFNVGLAPSAANGGDVNGNGKMKGAIVGNTDMVAYTLYSDSGLTTVWGNTATSASVGNGVSGTGAGMAAAKAVEFKAWAKVPSADVTPDSYADTVTVNVNY